MQYRLTPSFASFKKFGERYGAKLAGAARYTWLSAEDYELGRQFGQGASDQEVAAARAQVDGDCSPARVARVRDRLMKLGLLEPIEALPPASGAPPSFRPRARAFRSNLAELMLPAAAWPAGDRAKKTPQESSPAGAALHGASPHGAREPIEARPESGPATPEELMTDAGDEFGSAALAAPSRPAGSAADKPAPVESAARPERRQLAPDPGPRRDEPLLSDDFSLFGGGWEDEPAPGAAGRGLGGGAFADGFAGRGKLREVLARQGAAGRFARRRGETGEPEAERKQGAGSRGMQLASFSAGPLAHAGAFFARLLESRWSLAAVLFAVLLVLLGFWNNRGQIAADFAATIDFWYLLQRLIINLLLINLAEVGLRAGAMRRATGTNPKISLGVRFTLVHMVPWLFLQVDSSALRHVRDKAARYRIVAAPMLALALIIVGSGLLWMMSRRSGSMLHIYAMEAHILAWVFMAVTINPFGKNDFSRLVGMRLGIPGLRGVAFQALLDPRPIREAGLPLWPLRAYALASALVIVVLVSLIVYHGGRWLSELWGGLGIVYCLLVFGFLAYGPARRISTALGRRREASASARDVAPLSPARRGVWERRLLVLAILALIAVIPYDYETAGSFELLPVRKVVVHPQTEGEVRAVLVAEGDWVGQGQVLATLANEQQKRDVAEYQSRVAEVEANLAKAVAGPTPEQVAVARQKLVLAKTRYEFSRQAADRYRELMRNKFVSQQGYDDKEAQAKSDFDAMLLASRNLDELVAWTRKEDIDVLRAQLEQEKAKLEYHRTQLAFTEIRAPWDGQVVSGTLMYAVGDHLKPEDALLAIEDNRSLLVQVKVPETDIAIVPKVAQVRVRAWTLPEAVLEGRVTAVAPAADAEQYWRVVRVLMEFDNGKLRLPSGLTGYAKITCKSMPLIQAFTRMLVRFVMVEVWAWLP